MAKSKPAHEPHDPTSGWIIADAVYTLDAIAHRLQLGAAAMRSARRAGLETYKIGKRRYVIGRTFISWLEATGRKND